MRKLPKVPPQVYNVGCTPLEARHWCIGTSIGNKSRKLVQFGGYGLFLKMGGGIVRAWTICSNYGTSLGHWLKLFPGLVFPCKFTLTKDITSNQCCLRKFVGFWMLKNSNNSLEPTIRWDGEMAKLNIVGYVNQICLRKPMEMGSATIIWPWLIGLRHMKALD